MDAAIVYHDLCTRNAIDRNVVSVEPHAGKLRQERFRRVTNPKNGVTDIDRITVAFISDRGAKGGHLYFF
ncbi:MAG: hypothetical protein ACLTGI_07670 [Hoylesella buccalis]